MQTDSRRFPVLASAILFVASSFAHAGDSLNASAISLDLNPEIGIPLAGYGSKLRRLKPFDFKNKYPHSFFFKPSEGVHTPIRSKVLVLEKNGRHLVFISLDVVGVEKRFIRDLARELRIFDIHEEDLVVSGTHTHSGPGTLSRTLPLQLVATDLFRRENYNDILSKVKVSVAYALGHLEPAELFTSSFEAHDIQRNKFRNKDQEHFNKRASLLLARSKTTGKWLGGLVNFAIHGGGMPIELMLYSSDFPGQVELNLEAKLYELNGFESAPPAMLFMNGAEGDVTTPKRGVAYIEELGREFLRQAQVALEFENMTPVAPEFSVQRKRIWLGIPGSPLKYCVGGILKHSPIPLRVPLVGLFTWRTYLSLIHVGHITMMTWPGEASTTLGFQLQDLARKHGETDPWVLGLTNDYKAYFTTKSEYFQGAYDSCSSLFNWRGGKRILKAYGKMLNAREAESVIQN